MSVRRIERGHYFEDLRAGHIFEHYLGRTIAHGGNGVFANVTMNSRTSQSEIPEKRGASRPDRGAAGFRTAGFNQRGEKVIEHERPVPIRKRNRPGE